MPDKVSLRALREKMEAGYLLKIDEGRALLAIAEAARVTQEADNVIAGIAARGDFTGVSEAALAQVKSRDALRAALALVEE